MLSYISPVVKVKGGPSKVWKVKRRTWEHVDVLLLGPAIEDVLYNLTVSVSDTGCFGFFFSPSVFLLHHMRAQLVPPFICKS